MKVSITCIWLLNSNIECESVQPWTFFVQPTGVPVVPEADGLTEPLRDLLHVLTANEHAAQQVVGNAGQNCTWFGFIMTSMGPPCDALAHQRMNPSG